MPVVQKKRPPRRRSLLSQTFDRIVSPKPRPYIHYVGGERGNQTSGVAVKEEVKKPPEESEEEKVEEVEVEVEVKEEVKYDPMLMQHQLSHQTKANRFPKIFKSVLEFQPNPSRILSFGCSSGEECFALAGQYPAAEILGVDLDRWSIIQAKRKNVDFKERVGFSEKLEGEAGKFDIIFCLMVLFSIDKPISFEDFSTVIEKLSSHLNYRGLLVMYTGQHDVMATDSADKYSVIRQWTRQHNTDKRSYFNGYFRKVRH